jgi:hypothetical protein
MDRWTIENDPISFPSTHPGNLSKDGSAAFVEESVRFDPAVHLQFEPPKSVVDLNFQTIPFPVQDPNSFAGLAYTAPFRILSDEGVRVLRSIMDRESNNPRIKQSDNRTPLCLRGNFHYL